MQRGLYFIPAYDFLRWGTAKFPSVFDSAYRVQTLRTYPTIYNPDGRFGPFACYPILEPSGVLLWAASPASSSLKLSEYLGAPFRMVDT